MIICVVRYGKVVGTMEKKREKEDLPPWVRPEEIVSRYCWELKAAEWER
jgi:hypothetical protein